MTLHFFIQHVVLNNLVLGLYVFVDVTSCSSLVRTSLISICRTPARITRVLGSFKPRRIFSKESVPGQPIFLLTSHFSVTSVFWGLVLVISRSGSSSLYYYNCQVCLSVSLMLALDSDMLNLRVWFGVLIGPCENYAVISVITHAQLHIHSLLFHFDLNKNTNFEFY